MVESARTLPESTAPLWPMLAVAWADGELLPEESSVLRAALDELSWLDADSREAAASWMDPEQPPRPADLLSLVHRTSTLSGEAARSSFARALDVARRNSPFDVSAQEAMTAKLGALASKLAVEDDALLRLVERRLERETSQRASQGRDEKDPVFPPHEPVVTWPNLLARLKRSRTPWGDRIREVLAEPAFQAPLEEEKGVARERVLKRLLILAEQGFGRLAFPELAGEPGPAAFVEVFSRLCESDVSLCVKFGVQFGLFGGSILSLGNAEQHERYLSKVASVELPGAFAMTELGHGSNVRELETTLTWDEDGVVVHTPSPSARKAWIGNAAEHARMATVFGQLVVGGVSRGVHAVLVPIRHADGRLCDGVYVQDEGVKLGLNGVDNGAIWFDHVKVPQANLLDRYGGVDSAGNYHSPIESDTARFFTMLGTLVGGRVSVGSASLVAAAKGLSIALRYASHRRQFGPEGEGEIPLLAYPLHRQRLIPHVATALVLRPFAWEVQEAFHVHRSGEDARKLEVLAASLKVFATESAQAALLESRRACGGQGYLDDNEISRLLADHEVFLTFEGDNHVLRQLIARSVLSGLRQRLQDAGGLAWLRMLGDRANTTLERWRAPAAPTWTGESGTRLMATIFANRQEHLAHTLALRLRRRMSEGMDPFLAFTACQSHASALADAYMDAETLRAAIAFGERLAPGSVDEEGWYDLVSLHGMTRMLAAGSWMLEAGWVTSSSARAMRRAREEACDRLAERLPELLSLLDTPESLLRAPIAHADFFSQ